MNRVARRARFALILAVILVGGLAFFLGEYFLNAGKWVVFSGSPHVYSGGNLNSGVATDRDGEILLDMNHGRNYSGDWELREATLHILGDRDGNISAPALGYYSSQMVGFNPVNGIYTVGDQGGKAVLTVSAQVQKAALEAMDGRKGAIGVYNYKTGEILCMLSTPTYDPDDVPDLEEDEDGEYEGVYLNRFTQSTYVPGSIFKLVTASAALEEFPDMEERTYYCDGSYDIGADTVTCSGVHGTVDLGEALTDSCNVAFAQIALELGADKLNMYAKRFGITEPVEFDGITTAEGNFDVLDAADVNVAWGGIGQYTDLINPARYMTFMGQIANGGKAASPYLVSKVYSGALTKYSAKTTMVDSGLSTATANRMAELMRDNVVYGYGDWSFPDIGVCAKTGTAQIGEGIRPTATFAGFTTDENYPLAFVVFVEQGGGGSATCVSITAQVLEACVEAMGGD